jgi:hypothetical protein
MVLESKPTSPLAMSFPPSDGKKYKVQTGDDWDTIAAKAGIPTWGLIEFNFPAVRDTKDFQRKCREVNWLLRTHVGCTRSNDGKNYSFSSADAPGFVYIPQKPVPPGVPWHPSFYRPVVDPDEPVPVWEKRGSDWFGVGAKVSTNVQVVPGQGSGTETDHVVAKMYNLEAPAKNSFWLRAYTERVLGLGGDVSGNLVIVFISGIYWPTQLTRISQGDWDWSLALKGKWSSVAKSANKMGRLAKVARRLRQATSLEDLSEIASIIRAFWEVSGLRPGATRPEFVAIELPGAGAGVAASVYWGLTRFSVWSVQVED